jgi:hypothetical protein
MERHRPWWPVLAAPDPEPTTARPVEVTAAQEDALSRLLARPAMAPEATPARFYVQPAVAPEATLARLRVKPVLRECLGVVRPIHPTYVRPRSWYSGHSHRPPIVHVRRQAKYLPQEK